jgi:hypothetical protein
MCRNSTLVTTVKLLSQRTGLLNQRSFEAAQTYGRETLVLMQVHVMSTIPYDET